MRETVHHYFVLDINCVEHSLIDFSYLCNILCTTFQEIAEQPTFEQLL